MDFLYHYTSVDVLELILSNRTIRFNPLYKMDDQQEQYSAHGAAQGEHYFISSWTSEENELPRMWKDYCKPDPENGVRLKLPVNPFSKTENNLYQPVPEEAIKAELNREKIIRAILKYYPEVKRSQFEGFKGLEPFRKYKERLSNEHPTVAKQLVEASNQMMRETTMSVKHDVDKLLCQVQYTNDPRKLFPHLYDEYQGQMFGNFSDYGKYKNTSWEWQKEWRYILEFYRMRAFRKKADNTLEWYKVPFDYYDLKLDPVKLRQLEITTSPIISEDSKRKLNKILAQYLPGTPVKESILSFIE